MFLPPDVVIPLDDLHANIPAGFERDTDFDGLYVKITNSDWGNTGGSATHTHTSPSHTHTWTVNGHTHTTGNVSGNVSSIGNGSHRDSPPYDVTTTAHYHPSATSGVMTSASVSSEVATIGNANNEYSRYHLIFIRSLKYVRFPVNSIVMRSDVGVRAKASHFDSLDGRYMKGASTGADAGSGVDVSNHNHTQYHEHDMIHNHGGTSTGNTVSGDLGADNISGAMADHGHSISFTAHTQVATNNTPLPSAVSQLSYQELHFWKFTEQGFLKEGDVVIHTGAELPRGWEDLGYNDLYIRGKATGQALTTGGSNTHTHDAINHNHAGEAHTHPWTTNTVSANGQYRGGGSPMAGTHYHIGTTSSATNPDTGSTNLTVDTVNHEPQYIKVRLIRATKSALVGGGGVMQQHLD